MKRSTIYLLTLITVLCLTLFPPWRVQLQAETFVFAHLLEARATTTGTSDPVPDGAYPLTLSIWDAETGGNMLWSELHTVTTSEGLFSAEMGTLVPLPVDVFAPDSSDTLEASFLQMEFDGEVIVPRRRLGGLPYAQVANRLRGDVNTNPGSLEMTEKDPSGDESSTYMKVELEKAIITSYSVNGSGESSIVSQSVSADSGYSKAIVSSDGSSASESADGISLREAIQLANSTNTSGDSATFIQRTSVDTAGSGLIMSSKNSSGTHWWRVRQTDDANSSEMGSDDGTGEAFYVVLSDPVHWEKTMTATNTDGSSTTGHEVGHALGLYHTFETNSASGENAVLATVLGDSIPVDPNSYLSSAIEQYTPGEMRFEYRAEDGTPDSDVGIEEIVIAHEHIERVMSKSVFPSDDYFIQSKIDSEGVQQSQGVTITSSTISGNSTTTCDSTGTNQSLSFANGTSGDSSDVKTEVKEGGANIHVHKFSSTDGDADIFLSNENPFGPSIQLDKLLAGEGDRISLSIDSAGSKLAMSHASTGGGHEEWCDIRGNSLGTSTEFHFDNVGALPGTGVHMYCTPAGGGAVGINTSSPSEALEVNGNICATGTIGTCSDGRFKKNVEEIDNALELVEQLRGVKFDWKQNEFSEMRFADGQQIGLVAQEVKKVLPSIVSQGSDGYYSVDYAKLTPILLEAIKTQQAKINELEKLTSDVEKLKEVIKLLLEDKQ